MMKLNRTIALLLSLLLLLPCFVTAAFADMDDGDWLVHESTINEQGYVCTKETMKSSYGAKHVYTYTFDKAGRLLTSAESNREDDGVKFSNTKTCTYNKAGDLITEAYSFRDSGGYFERYLAVYTYDEKGNLTKETFNSQNEEGTEVNVRKLTYDAKGNKIKTVIDHRQADGITSRDVFTFTYDKQNRVIKKKVAYTSNTDLVSYLTVKYTFKNGRLAKETSV